MFVHRPTLDFELIEAEERPAVVVSLLTERFLVRVPFDQPFTAHARASCATSAQAGEVLAPRDEPYLRPDVWPPLNLGGGLAPSGPGGPDRRRRS